MGQKVLVDQVGALNAQRRAIGIGAIAKIPAAASHHLRHQPDSPRMKSPYAGSVKMTRTGDRLAK